MGHYFNIFFRNLVKKPAFFTFTFMGFTIGIAAGILIYLWIYNELNYDKFHLDYNRIYRVLTLSKQGNEIVKSAGCYRPVAATLKKDYPQIEYATFLSYSSEDSPLQSKEGGEKFEARELWVSNDFFSIFNGFIFIEGMAFDAIEKPSNIILSETVAKKLFGNERALGKTVIIDKFSKEFYTVAGVVRIPKQSHIDFGYILPEINSEVVRYLDNWSDRGYVHVYIKIRKDAKIDDKFLGQITNHISRYSNKTDKLMFQPLSDIHLFSDYETGSIDKNISSYKYILIFSGLALLIIFMASFNFSVLSMARASERSTEIGIKKVNGAGRFQIISQFMGESVFQTFAAALLALFIIWIILPHFNNFTGKVLSLNFSLKFLINLFLLILFTGIIAGIYPSFFLSSLKPNSIFRGGTISGSRDGFIRILVSVQFCIAIFFMISTSFLIRQLNFVRSKDLGFNHENIVVIPTGLWYDNNAFKNELLKNPNILGVSASAYAPVDFGWKTTLALNHQGVTDSLNISLFWVDEDFAKTYRLEMVKGQFLQMNYKAFWKELDKANKSRNEGKDYTVSIPIVINETAEKQLGFTDPIGQRIGSNIIVGVVKDFHFRPLHYPIGPVMLLNDPQNIMTMNVRISPQNRAKTITYIRDVYQKHRNERGFSYSYFDDLLSEQYQEDIRLKNMTIIFSVLAIIIAVLGILSMAVFSVNQKVKEIGIRKVNGASVSEILIMLNKDFVKWVVIAFVIATPVAFFTIHKWLQNFAYRITLNWWVFVLAGLLAMVIAMLVVSFQSWKVATRNPVEALRHE